MSRLRRLCLLFILPGLLAAAVLRGNPPELSADPALVSGSLPNGLGYRLLANHEPRDRISLRLVVHAGSFEEKDTQRGLAHFLEHMAFNGSTHYPPGTLVGFFQRLGMNFGGDTNAYTSFDRTVYQLELPNTDAATIREGLRVFADYGGELLLSSEEIDRERGVILSEKLARDSADYRARIAGLKFLLGQTRVYTRLPIGTEPVIKSLGRDDFVDFYNAWYRPENMTLVAVGDFDPVVFEQTLRAADSPLAGLKARAPAQPKPDLGSIDTTEGLRVGYHYEADATKTIVSIETIVPQGHIPDTAGRRLALLPRQLATAMVNRRLQILAKAESAPFLTGHIGIDDGFDLYRNAAIELTVSSPSRWAEALTLAEHELRRALEHGFTPSELKEAGANFKNALQQAVATAATRRSPGLAEAISASVIDRTVFTSPGDDLALLGPALDTITPEDCHHALREAFRAPAFHVSVMGKSKIDKPEESIRAAYENALSEPVTAPEQTDDETFAYTDFGPDGSVADRKDIDDLGITLVTFANGVRLNLKKTDFESDTIRLSARVGAGQLTEPFSEPGLAWYSGLTFTAGGLGRHGVDDLNRLFAGRNVGLNFAVQPDALAFSGATTPEDLPLELQLLAAYLTDPGYRPEASRVANKAIEQIYEQLETTPQGALQTRIPQLLSGGDPRFGLPSREQALNRTLDEVREWLGPQLRLGAIELAVVGDLDVETTINAVAKTLGALPERIIKPPLDDARVVNFPDSPLNAKLTFRSDIPKGLLAYYWHTTDNRDVHLARRLSLLADIFSDRLRVKVREEIGGAYSPSAASIQSDTYKDYGWLVARITHDPDRAKEIDRAVLSIAKDLHDHGVTEDEFERARRPIFNALAESVRTNGYWLGAVLGAAQEQTQRLEWARTRESDFKAITIDELNALAKRYLTPGSVNRFDIEPMAKENTIRTEPVTTAIDPRP